ncbi:MAG: hypothetical protein ABI432_11290 [Flavobacteriales bacterium]
MAIWSAYRHLSISAIAICAILFSGSLVGCSRENDQGPLLMDGALTERGLEEAARITGCADLEMLVAREFNGFMASSSSAQHAFLLEYRPAMLQLCITSGSPSDLKAPAFIAEMERSRATDMYVMKVPRTDEGNEKAVDEEFLLYLSNAAVKDLVEVVGEDTVECAFVHLETTPAIGPYHHMILGFDSPQDGKQRKIVWHDGSGLLGKDLVFEFKAGSFDQYEKILAQALMNSSSMP